MQHNDVDRGPSSETVVRENTSRVEQTSSLAHDDGPDQFWSVDAHGDALLVAQSERAEVHLGPLTADDSSFSSVDAPVLDPYDGHIPLVLDGHELVSIDVVLDVLASSPDLFDVPTVDVPDAGGDTSAA